jgi:hypothetical protein
MIRDAEEFVSLRLSELAEDYNRAANEEAELDVWKDVIFRFPEMKSWVALNKTVPVEILKLLLRDADPKVRSCVAMKRKLDRELFEALVADPSEEVRVRIAYNAKTPRDLLERLLTDASAMVRSAALERL